MIVVTGANGQLGRGVIEHLHKLKPAEKIVASVRDPGRGAPLAEIGVELRTGDFARPETLTGAFADASQVLVVSVDRLGEEARQWHRTAIEAARGAGARRVLYTSHMGTHAGSVLSDHFAAEAVLAESGEAFTSLRHGFYADSAFHLIGRGLELGDIRAPEDGPVSWTTRADLAEADAVVLADEGRLDGVSPPLTAPQASTLADIAAAASEIIGREIRRTVLTDEEWRDAKLAEGAPAPMADALLGMFRGARRGDFAATDPTLETLIGRRPDTMRDVLARVLRHS